MAPRTARSRLLRRITAKAAAAEQSAAATRMRAHSATAAGFANQATMLQRESLILLGYSQGLAEAARIVDTTP